MTRKVENELLNEAVLYEKRGKIALLTINRPEAMNAINSEVWKGIGTALDDFAEDRDLWCAIITGAGDKSFCVGADLKALARGENVVPDGGEKWGFAGITQHYINKPIIAAVNGFAFGGGTEIALACDLVIASENATFGLPEVKRGIIAGAGGLLRLPRQIPLKVAMEKILTGNPISSDEAKGWGLINRVVSHEQLLIKAIEFAEEIIENAPVAVSASKDIIYKSLDVPLDHPSKAWEINEEYTQSVMHSEDSKEGPKAFAEKRKPQWLGR